MMVMLTLNLALDRAVKRQVVRSERALSVGRLGLPRGSLANMYSIFRLLYVLVYS